MLCRPVQALPAFQERASSRLWGYCSQAWLPETRPLTVQTPAGTLQGHHGYEERALLPELSGQPQLPDLFSAETQLPLDGQNCTRGVLRDPDPHRLRQAAWSQPRRSGLTLPEGSELWQV